MADSPVLAIGPANYAGQAFEWAEAVNRWTSGRAWSFNRGPVRRRHYGFPAHKVIHPLWFHFGLARRPRSKRLFRDTTHIALDGYESYYRRPRARRILEDAQMLVRQGFQCALIAHGTDVRDPNQHMERLAWSYFQEASQEWRDARASSSRRNREAAERSGLPLFVSTPDLLLDQPSATWLPLTIDVASWRAEEPPMERAVPRVLHLPSRRVPPIKGTQYVDPVMERLERAGRIEYVSPQSVPHSEVKALVRGCDIVIDQILTGCYGVAAVEAMAAGRVVIGSLAPDVRALMPESPPLIDANPETLETEVSRALEERELARRQAASGVGFVARWHDGRAAAAALSDYLGLRSSATC